MYAYVDINDINSYSSSSFSFAHVKSFINFQVRVYEHRNYEADN